MEYYVTKRNALYGSSIFLSYQMIEKVINEAYRTLFDEDLPSSVTIEFLPRNIFERRQLARFPKSAPKRSAAYIFIRVDGKRAIISVDQDGGDVDALIWVGHEIGHLRGYINGNVYDYHGHLGELPEEMKAYSFQRLWAQTIIDGNIGGFGEEVQQFTDEYDWSTPVRLVDHQGNEWGTSLSPKYFSPTAYRANRLIDILELYPGMFFQALSLLSKAKRVHLESLPLQKYKSPYLP